MKRPAFQFYPADWRKDPALSVCSLAARGLWIELLCIAHESDEYGYLVVNGNPMTDAQLSRTIGESSGVLAKLLGELHAAGVFSRDSRGAIFSRRMIRDEDLRKTRAACGKLGGNPDLVKQKDNQKPPDEVNQTDKQTPTPSASALSSSSASAKEREPSGSRLPRDWTLPEEWAEFARAEKPGLDVPRVAEGFRDYWIAVAGARGRKADWFATWRTWVRREDPAKPQSQADKLSATAEAMYGNLVREMRGNPTDISGTAKRLD